jgi:hypothetical protein
MKVTLVDQSVDVLKKAIAGIEQSLGKVAKKQFANDAEVRFEKLSFLAWLLDWFNFIPESRVVCPECCSADSDHHRCATTSATRWSDYWSDRREFGYEEELIP